MALSKLSNDDLFHLGTMVTNNVGTLPAFASLSVLLPPIAAAVTALEAGPPRRTTCA